MEKEKNDYYYKPGSLWKNRRTLTGRTELGQYHTIPFDSIIMLVAHQEERRRRGKENGGCGYIPFSDGDFIFLWNNKTLLIVEEYLDVGHDLKRINLIDNDDDDDDGILES